MAAPLRSQVLGGLAVIVLTPFLLAWHIIKAMPTFFLVAGLMWLGWWLLSLLNLL